MKRAATFLGLQTQQPQHIAQILPDVLARYGLSLDCGALEYGALEDEEGEFSPDGEFSPAGGVEFLLAESSLTEFALSVSLPVTLS